MKRLVLAIGLICTVVSGATDDATIVRMIRAYGGTDERMPPIINMRSSDNQATGFPFATVEFDVSASTIPNVYARLTHCKADWVPDENGFLNDVTNRTSIVDWTLGPQRSQYYRYRGKIKLPNEQTTFRFSGNWRVTLHDINNDEVLAETKVFVVDDRATMRMAFMTDFYQPTKRVSSIAFTIEALVVDPTGNLLTNNLHTLALYRNHRWLEPLYASERARTASNPRGIGADIVGMVQGGKVFRISRIPAQNEYRVLDLTDLARYPFVAAPVRMPLSDLRRNGMFLERADDGAMISNMVSTSNDEFVPIEMMLDPAPGGPSTEDVFLVGSFNNWKPDRTWMMYYDEEYRLYRLRQWIRRGRHNYLYATGRLSADSDQILDLTYDEMEGNTASASNSFIAFAYYRELDYGGYDGIVAVANSNFISNNR